eukprot:3423917-Rhodomonas_salina.1
MDISTCNTNIGSEAFPKYAHCVGHRSDAESPAVLHHEEKVTMSTSFQHVPVTCTDQRPENSENHRDSVPVGMGMPPTYS